jgi:C-3',4' desaturase CrtD
MDRRDFDVAVVGAGMAGMATAARLQARGLRTVVLEAHGLVGGCAGYFRRKGFSFDVGATTLVDFEAGGVGGQLLDEVGMNPLAGESLPGYVAWLPDREIVLHRDVTLWRAERLRVLGSSPAHRAFWQLLDELAEIFWEASREGIKLPIRSPRDLANALGAVGLRHLPRLRYAGWTVGDALRSFGLRDDRPLVGLLSMLIEDTVHSTVERAPLLNAALGITIRGAGLTRPQGGMRGFWEPFVAQYRRLGGTVKVGWRVDRIERRGGSYSVTTRKGTITADQVVSALPVSLTARIAPTLVERALRGYLRRDEACVGGAIVVFLGVPEGEVQGEAFTHHQLLQSYNAPLGSGNNMFVSVSAAGDVESAPPEHRAVMVSTHCELGSWEHLDQETYERRKRAAGARLIALARRVYPSLGERPVIYEIATPRTFQRYTGRPRGAVGGVRQTLSNSNQHAVPHELGPRGFWLAGDTTWPGLGTVACVLGSRIVADGVLRQAEQADRRHAIRSRPAPAMEAA